MFSPTRMLVRVALVLMAAVIFTGGCSDAKPAPFEPESKVLRDDREAPFNPQERYPGWAFDQPEYMQPINALDAERPVRSDDPDHFFTNRRVVMVEQPGGYTMEELPRVAVYKTDDNGFTWKRDGFFGREQEYYALETDCDGDYGIRFVGPGQELAERTPADPIRVYHVDTVPPDVDIQIKPQKSWYDVGEEVEIAWAVRDPHLLKNPVRIGMLMDFTGDIRDLIELQRDLDDEGSMVYRIAPNTAGHEVVFRVEAMDRSENLGLAYSHHLQVINKDEEQIVKRATHHPHDDRVRESNPPRTVPIRPNHSDPAPMTPISKAGNKKDATNTERETVVASVSVTADPNAATIMRPECEDDVTPKSIVIRQPADETVDQVDSPAMTDCDEEDDAEFAFTMSADGSVAPTPSKSNATNSQMSHAKGVTMDDALEPLKNAFQSLKESVVNAAENANKAEATAKAENESKVEQPAKQTKPTPVTLTVTESRNTKRSTNTTTARTVSTTPTMPAADTLVAPMPGTIANNRSTLDTAHPWRSLGGTENNAANQVWSLPDSKTGVYGRPEMRTVETAPTTNKRFVGVPTEDESPSK